MFTVKQKADNSIEKHKARLVLEGFTWIYGVNYQETFTPITKMNTTRISLSYTANFNWDLRQFSVKNVFLHGDLEEVYMEIPPRFDDERIYGKVCRLKKALYGLNQSPRAWFEWFNIAIISFGYKQSNVDHILIIKHYKGKMTSLIVYIDDIMMTRDDKE